MAGRDLAEDFADEHAGLAGVVEEVHLLLQRGALGRFVAVEILEVADGDAASDHLGTDAVPRHGLEFRAALDRHEAALRLGDDGARDGMLAARLDRRGEPEQFLFRCSAICASRVVGVDDDAQVGDDGTTLGQRAGFVERDDVDPPPLSLR